MRLIGVVMLHVLAGEVIEVTRPHHDEPVEALSLDGLDEPLRVGVEVGRAVGQADGRDALASERPVERLSELRVTVPGQHSALALAGQALEAGLLLGNLCGFRVAKCGVETVYMAPMHGERGAAPRRIPFGKPPDRRLADVDE